LRGTLRADLHVHTCHSKQSGTLPFLGSRDCYSRPADVHRVARARGMDLVCLTDHDSIDGALELLAQRPGADDVIVGEEITCRLPDGDVEVHIAAYDMTEALHRDVQHLRGNVFDVTARLRQARVFFALNHLLHFFRRQLPLDRYLELVNEVPALEVRNGTMLPAHNLLCERVIATASDKSAPVGMIGGSDAHTLRRVGTTWTEAPGTTREQFMDSLRRGRGRPGGRHGGTAAVAGDAYGVVSRYIAALAGFGPQDVRSWRRAACLTFAAVSLPFQVAPALVAAARKSAERRIVREVTDALASLSEAPQPRRDKPSSESPAPSPEASAPRPEPRGPSPEPRRGSPIGAPS
jgi:predicted metal-dependent phosphoesterase TrpH